MQLRHYFEIMITLCFSKNKSFVLIEVVFFPLNSTKLQRQDIKMMLALQERRIKSLLSTPDKLSKIILTEKIIKFLLFFFFTKKHKSTSQHNFTQLRFKDFCSDIFLLDQFPLLYFLEANAKLILTSKKCSKIALLIVQQKLWKLLD